MNEYIQKGIIIMMIKITVLQPKSNQRRVGLDIAEEETLGEKSMFRFLSDCHH